MFQSIGVPSSSGTSSPRKLICLTLKREALRHFKMLGTICSVTKHRK